MSMTVASLRPALLLGFILLLSSSHVTNGLRVPTFSNPPSGVKFGRELLDTDALGSADAGDASDSVQDVNVLQEVTTADAMQACQEGYCTTSSGQTFCKCKYMGCSEYLCYKQGGGPTTDGSPGTNPTKGPLPEKSGNGGGDFWQGVASTIGTGIGSTIGSTIGTAVKTSMSGNEKSAVNPNDNNVGPTNVVAPPVAGNGGMAVGCPLNGMLMPQGTSIPCAAGGQRLCHNGQWFSNGFC